MIRSANVIAVIAKTEEDRNVSLKQTSKLVNDKSTTDLNLKVTNYKKQT